MAILVILFIACFFFVRHRRRGFMRGENLRKYSGDFHGVYALFIVLALLAGAFGLVPGWAMALAVIFGIAGIVGVIALGKDTPGYRGRRRRRR